MTEPEDILHFWFVEKGPQFWWKKSDAFDAEIRERFEADAIHIASRMSTSPHHWEFRSEHSLALIILLDQFPRNMYRDTPAAFAWDDYAIGAAKRMVDKNWDMSVPLIQRQFAYMPYMHSEHIDDQDTCVSLFESRLNDEGSVFHAQKHRDMIVQFGRFPHRNTILGRENTIAEQEYLDSGGYTP